MKKTARVKVAAHYLSGIGTLRSGHLYQTSYSPRNKLTELRARRCRRLPRAAPHSGPLLSWFVCGILKIDEGKGEVKKLSQLHIRKWNLPSDEYDLILTQSFATSFVKFLRKLGVLFRYWVLEMKFYFVKLGVLWYSFVFLSLNHYQCLCRLLVLNVLFNSELPTTMIGIGWTICRSFIIVFR